MFFSLHWIQFCVSIFTLCNLITFFCMFPTTQCCFVTRHIYYNVVYRLSFNSHNADSLPSGWKITSFTFQMTFILFGETLGCKILPLNYPPLAEPFMLYVFAQHDINILFEHNDSIEMKSFSNRFDRRKPSNIPAKLIVLKKHVFMFNALNWLLMCSKRFRFGYSCSSKHNGISIWLL